MACTNLSVGLFVRLFGPMEVRIDGEPLPPLRSRKVIWALALLILRGNRPASREWLARSLWPDAEREVAMANLRPVFSDLRRVLGSQCDRLKSIDRTTVAFDADGADVDVTTFDTLVKSEKRVDLITAVDLYRGSLLEGCNEEWVGQERLAREESCLQALQRLGEIALSAGEYDGATSLFQRAIGIDPWRDSPRRGLMETLSQSGDTNAALHVYREFADFVRRESGTVPGEETTTLYRRLRRDLRSSSKTSVAPPDQATVESHFPNPLTRIVGREDERSEVASQIHRSRLVTLTGTGGIGKTRLALAVASEILSDFADGVWLVTLESLPPGSSIERQIASVLALRESAEQAPLRAIIDHLRKRRLVLLLDNCEHVLQSCAQAVSEILRECRDVRFLATSREALGILGETVWIVPPLAIPVPEALPKGIATMQRVLMGYESVELFVERARSHNRSFTLSGTNAFLIAQVCAHLEGIPLAIELTAARTKSMTVDAIYERLKSPQTLEIGGMRGVSARQQTLNSTLDWSFGLLDENERTVLTRLSVFVGGWTLEAAEEVCRGGSIQPNDVSHVLSQLVDKSLVTFDESRPSNAGRYRLLEMVRQYASAKLGNSMEADQVRSQHQQWFLALAKAAEPHLKGADQSEWLRRLSEDYANLLAALEFVGPDDSLSLELIGAMWRYWYVRGDYVEGLAYLIRGIETHPELTISRLKALQGAGLIRFSQGKLAEARTLQEEALLLSRSLEFREGIADSLGHLASTFRRLGDDELVRVLTEECLVIRDEIGDRHGTAVALSKLGIGPFERGEFKEARASFEKSNQIFTELGDKHLTTWSLLYLASIDEMQGRFEEAILRYETCLTLSREIGDKRGIAVTMVNLGDVHYNIGDIDEARLLFETSLAALEEMGDSHGMVWAFLGLAELDLTKRDPIAARANVERCLVTNREYGDDRVSASAHRILAAIGRFCDDPEHALGHIRECLTKLRQGNHKSDGAVSLEVAAGIALAQGQFERSAHLLGAANGLRTLLETAIPPVLRPVQEDLCNRLRAQLGESLFESAFREGEQMDWQQATAYALIG